MKVLVVEHIISWDHAMKIVRKLKTKAAQKLGYCWDVEDLNMNIWARPIEEKFAHLKKPKSELVPRYADYAGGTEAFHLRVYRDIEPKA